MPERLLAFLAANRPSAFCQTCLAQSLEATLRDTRATLKVALIRRIGIAIKRGPCDRCRSITAITTLKA